MRMEWRLITPEVATSLLKNNAGNRNLRSTVVEHYADQMKRGEWKPTHQAIAIGADENIIDGQHRLSAIVKSGLPQWFWLCTYESQSGAMGLPIDLQARRNAADILQRDKRATEVASIMCRLVAGNMRSVPVDKIRDVLEAFGRTIERVNNANRNKGVRRTAASVRTAVVLRMQQAQSEGAKANVLMQYKAFAEMDFEACWLSTQSLIKQFDQEATHLTGQGHTSENWRLIRTWKAFDWSSRDVKVIRVGADDRSLDEMREAALAHLPQSWK